MTRTLQKLGRRIGLVSFFVMSPGLMADSADAQRKTNPGSVRRAQPWEGLAVSTKAVIVVNGRRHETTTNAQCEYDDRATPGSSRWQWMVLYPPIGVRQNSAEPLSGFSVTLWRPSGNAAPGFTYSMTVNGKSSLIQTFGRPSGSGKASVRRVASGATFTVSGRDEAGQTVNATIACSLVRKPEAQAGG